MKHFLIAALITINCYSFGIDTDMTSNSEKIENELKVLEQASKIVSNQCQIYLDSVLKYGDNRLKFDGVCSETMIIILKRIQNLVNDQDKA